MSKMVSKCMSEVVKEVLKECETRYGVDCKELLKEYDVEEEEQDVFCIAPPMTKSIIFQPPSATDLLSPLTQTTPPVAPLKKKGDGKKEVEAEAKKQAKEEKRLESEAKKEATRLEKEAAKRLEKEAKRLESEAKKEAKKEATRLEKETKRLEKEAKKNEKKGEKKPRTKKAEVVVAAPATPEEEEKPVRKVKIYENSFFQSTTTGMLYDFDKYRVNGELVLVGKWPLSSNDPKDVEWMDLDEDEDEEEEYESAEEDE